MTLSLEEITTSFQEACATESQSMFLQGDILTKGIRDGLTVKEVFRACGQVSGKSYRTICNRFKTSKVFTPDKRAAHIDWSLHQLCTTGVDLDKPETYAIAYQWLDTAIKGRETADGWKPHSYASLKAQIVANGGKPEADEPKYIFDNVEGVIVDSGKYFVTIAFECGVPELTAAVIPVFVTIVQPVQTPAQEAI